MQRNAEDSLRMDGGVVRVQKSRESASENFSIKTTHLLGINKKALVLVATVSLLNLRKCHVHSDGRNLVEMLWGEKNTL